MEWNAPRAAAAPANGSKFPPPLQRSLFACLILPLVFLKLTTLSLFVAVAAGKEAGIDERTAKLVGAMDQFVMIPILFGLLARFKDRGWSVGIALILVAAMHLVMQFAPAIRMDLANTHGVKPSLFDLMFPEAIGAYALLCLLVVVAACVPSASPAQPNADAR